MPWRFPVLRPIPSKTAQNHHQSDDNGKDRLLALLSAKISKFKTTFGLDDAGRASLVAEAACFHYCLNAPTQTTRYAQTWTACKNAARSGTDAALGPLPVAPALGTAPAASRARTGRPP